MPHWRAELNFKNVYNDLHKLQNKEVTNLLVIMTWGFFPVTGKKWMVAEQNLGMFYTDRDRDLYGTHWKNVKKQLQKSLAWINIWIIIYLQIHRALLLPPSFTITYLLPESLVSSLSSSNCSSLHPQQNLQKQTEPLLLWCNSAQAWQSPEITLSPSQLPYATGRAEDRHRSPSWGQDIVACKKNKLL